MGLEVPHSNICSKLWSYILSVEDRIPPHDDQLIPFNGILSFLWSFLADLADRVKRSFNFNKMIVFCQLWSYTLRVTRNDWIYLKKYWFRSVFLTIRNSFCRTCTFVIFWTDFCFTMKVCNRSVIIWIQSFKSSFCQNGWNWKSNGMKCWISIPILIEIRVTPFAWEGFRLWTDSICGGWTKLIPEKGRVVSGFGFF